LDVALGVGPSGRGGLGTGSRLAVESGGTVVGGSAHLSLALRVSGRADGVEAAVAGATVGVLRARVAEAAEESAGGGGGRAVGARVALVGSKARSSLT